MASWDQFDTKNNLLQKWLGAFRAVQSVSSTGSAFEYRSSDTDNNILAKLARNYSAAFSTPNTDDYAWRPLDSDADILRKILSSLHYGVTSLPNNDSFSWRPLDGDVLILKKLVRCHCAITATNSPYDNVRAQDNDVWCIRKIIIQQASAGNGNFYTFNSEPMSSFAADPLARF